MLNGVTIKSNEGEAIYVEQAKNTVIELSEGSNNTLEDSATRSDESIDGTIYSKDDLIFTGTGTLDVVSNFADDIVSKDDLKFISGNYIIKSEDNAIHAEEKMVIDNGTIDIQISVEGLEATLMPINGGNITIKASDDAINAAASNFSEPIITINDGTIDITVGEGDTDAIDSNGDIIVNGEEVNKIPENMMGGGARMGGGRH
ncbi:carbohydrate-binding domain-containing protein [Melissococcus sp. OM08-11BH]|uniref:carbohydrate-binding domain-containing protein n=1 Tax=Melissococcus sp. OM08-11BH TaxID=2293110 RepID=UPI002104603B|nr:carbohydrate-binding domain-containing protein [Melissococcus sp. OM08-11BH]